MNNRRISLDSCSILHLLSETPTWFPHVKRLYDDAVAGRCSIVVSEVSVAECLRLEATGGKVVPRAEAIRTIGLFFSQSFVVRRSITSRESSLAGTLIEAHGLGTCDALVAATAVYADAEVLYTTDGCTHRRKAGKLLTVSEIVTPCGKRMRVEPPDAATCAALQAAKPPATKTGGA